MGKQSPSDAEISSVTSTTLSRHPLSLSGTRLLALSFSALGIIYSDIGTSPLYVLSTIWPSTGDVPDEEDVIGGISAIFWAFTLLPLVKYIFIALNFGSTTGEGGPFALYLQMYPRRPAGTSSEEEDRELTKFSTADGIAYADGMAGGVGRKMGLIKWPLLVWTLFGTALTIADGILTPAVSITSSVGGLGVVAPIITTHIIPISIGFLVVLFLAQTVGTHRLSWVFAPVTAIWLLLIGVCGIINTTKAPGIYRALDPSRAIMYFVRTGNYDALAGVLLALTGCEAVFANLGQFNKRSIQLSFVTLVYPCLMFAYLGQGAALIDNGAVVITNPFYESIPGGAGSGVWYLTWVFGVLACLIASQAMITATFTLIHQLIGMKCFPSLKVKHTSTLTEGQIYIPAVNWLLMIGCICSVAGFGSSFALTLAYGFAVATVMFVTTTLITLQIPVIKGRNVLFGVAFFLFFGFLDGLFWGASLKKVPSGAWYPLAMGSVICICMVFWTWGRTLEDGFDSAHKQNLKRIIYTTPSGRQDDAFKLGALSTTRHAETAGVPTLSRNGESLDNNQEGLHTSTTKDDRSAHHVPEEMWIQDAHDASQRLTRINTFAIFHKTTDGQGVPHAFTVFLRRVPALPRIVVFLSIQTVAVPHLPLEDRYLLSKVRSLDGFFGCVMRKGYMDRIGPEVDEIMERIITIESKFSVKGLDERVREIRDARANVTYIMPNYNLVSRPTSNRFTNWFRSLLLEGIYGRLRVMFPDDVAGNGSSEDGAEQTLKVGVVAMI